MIYPPIFCFRIVNHTTMAPPQQQNPTTEHQEALRATQGIGSDSGRICLHPGPHFAPRPSHESRNTPTSRLSLRSLTIRTI